MGKGGWGKLGTEHFHKLLLKRLFVWLSGWSDLETRFWPNSNKVISFQLSGWTAGERKSEGETDGMKVRHIDSWWNSSR